MKKIMILVLDTLKIRSAFDCVSYLETAGNRLHSYRATMPVANAAAGIYLEDINMITC